MFAAGSVGAIIGALVVNRIQKRIGVGPTIIAMAVLFSVAGIAVPLAPKSFPLPLLIGSFFVTQFGGVAYNITQVSLRQAITPERLQGRMNAAMRWIVWGTIPLGTLLGGALAQVFTLRTALFVSAIGGDPHLPPRALLTAAAHARDARRRSHRRPRRRQSSTAASSSRCWAVPCSSMPELPEMEAWRRQLNDPVSAFPIAKAGPAHIATLKTFDPPLKRSRGGSSAARSAAASASSSRPPTASSSCSST